MACTLTFLDGPRANTQVRLDQPTFTLGRDPRCEIAFDPQSDLLVSGQHARIARQAADAFVLTDSSSNGTFVNGARVTQHALCDGDVIELGQGGPRLRFARVARAVAADQPPPTRQQPARQQPLPAPPAPAPQQALVPAPPAPDARRQRQPTSRSSIGAGPALAVTIRVLPDGAPQRFEQPVIRIGRDPAAEVALDAYSALLVSANHAKIMVIEGEAVLFDLESTNGTLSHGKRISRLELSGTEEIELGPGGPRLQITVETTRAVSGRVPTKTIFGDATPLATGLSLGDAELLQEVPLQASLTIGRDADAGCDIVLDSMYVSKRHASLERDGTTLWLRDHSVNGTFVDGERVSETTLAPGAEVMVGPYLLKVTDVAVRIFDTRTKLWIDARGLSRVDPKTRRAFLDDISLRVEPGEFVCILGPSGCGKSTLLKSLNGYTPADRGSVRLNNIDFYANYERLKHQVGYVPQDDIIHPQLSIERTLEYAAKLRLPPGTSTAKRKERVDDVLSMLELSDHRHKPVHKLSGGQRKRVSIGVELLTEPAIIYLDEPTSGLDPNLEEKMMLLLRELSLRGKTVVAVTHTLDNIQLADKVIFLVDGKLAFFGTPGQAREFFEVERLPDVYKRFDAAKRNTDALRERFSDSPLYADHIGVIDTDAASSPSRPRKGRRIGPGPLRQLGVLTRRYAEIITRDLRNTLILLLQAPLVALFICAAVRTNQPERGPTSTMFLIMSLSALWFGCSNAARELTKERSIYARERMVNLRVLPYVASKVFVLQLLSLLQVTTMLLIVDALRGGFSMPAADVPHECKRYGIIACQTLILDGVPGSFGQHLLNLYLTALNGLALGLLVSAIAGNSDKAMSLVPLILIPQVLFSGSFGVPQADEPLKRGAGYVMALNWSLDQSKRIAICEPEQEQGRTGCTRCLHGYDPFKHRLLGGEQQDEDRRCAAVVPLMAQMIDFPEALEVVEDGLYTPRSGHASGAAREATRSFHGLYVLGGYTLVLLLLVCLFVRLKDRQNQ